MADLIRAIRILAEAIGIPQGTHDELEEALRAHSRKPEAEDEPKPQPKRAARKKS
jgi:hypothetical protein